MSFHTTGTLGCATAANIDAIDGRPQAGVNNNINETHADRFDEFMAANTHSVIAAYLVQRGDLPRLFASTNATNVVLAHCVDDWIAQVRRGERPLCLKLGCTHEFTMSGEPPAAYVIVLPYARNEGIA
jgi:hypothetical protein